MTWHEMMAHTVREQVSLWGVPIKLVLGSRTGFSAATLTDTGSTEVVLDLRAVRATDAQVRARSPAGEVAGWEVEFMLDAADDELAGEREPVEGDSVRVYSDGGVLLETLEVVAVRRESGGAALVLGCSRRA